MPQDFFPFFEKASSSALSDGLLFASAVVGCALVSHALTGSSLAFFSSRFGDRQPNDRFLFIVSLWDVSLRDLCWSIIFSTSPRNSRRFCNFTTALATYIAYQVRNNRLLCVAQVGSLQTLCEKLFLAFFSPLNLLNLPMSWSRVCL